jgi:hypothetical protein
VTTTIRDVALRAEDGELTLFLLQYTNMSLELFEIIPGANPQESHIAVGVSQSIDDRGSRTRLDNLMA